MNLLPLGSVIEVKGKTLSIVGYTTVNDGDAVVSGYCTVPYPIGYIGVDKVFFIPHFLEMTVLEKGFEDEYLTNMVRMLGANFTIAEQYPTLDPNVIVQKYKEVIDKRKENKR